MRFHKPDIILCDLDGTLVDSVPDLAWCTNAMLRRLTLPEHPEALIRNWVGNGLNTLLKRALTGTMNEEPDPNLLGTANALFRVLYEQHTCQHSRLYEGVKHGLSWLRAQKIRLACVTNKDERFTLPVLRTLGIAHYFDIVISGDSLAHKKPHPEPLLHAAAYFGVTPANAIMIGDSVNDVKASRAAGFRIICTSYGYNHGMDIRTTEPDAVIDNFIELENLFIET